MAMLRSIQTDFDQHSLEAPDDMAPGKRKMISPRFKTIISNPLVCFIRPISGEVVEGWLSDELGPDIVREIELAVEERSALSEYIYKYTSCTYPSRYEGPLQKYPA